jgi:hypothetical protein
MSDNPARKQAALEIDVEEFYLRALQETLKIRELVTGGVKEV